MKCPHEPFEPCNCMINQTHDQKFPKPGKKEKKKLQTKRLLKHNIEPPTDRACVNCKVETGTECYHHAESTKVKSWSGGGIMGSKINDRLTAWLCNGARCGEFFDTKPVSTFQGIINVYDTFTMEMIIKTHLL